VILCLAGGRYLYLKNQRNQTQRDVEMSPNSFQLSSEVVETTRFNKLFGGNKYAELHWTDAEKEKCYKETGLYPNSAGKIGSGHYGDVSACWDGNLRRQYVRGKYDLN